MKTKILLLAMAAILLSSTTRGQIIDVPADQPTIQAGIDAATNCDTVLVAQGTYFENINFNGKAITVASHYLVETDSTHINNTIINGSQPSNPDFASVVTFVTGEDTTSILCGFTITGGSGMYLPSHDARIGGGIVCYYASAKIIHNIIEGNEVNYSNHAWGAGIASIKESGYSWTIVTGNTIRDNQSTAGSGGATGGGAEIWGNARISNNRIENNHCISASGFSGGGGVINVSINNPLDTLLFENNTISYNSVASNNAWCAGGGLYMENVYSVITNNIFEFNTSEGFSYSHGGAIKVNYGEATIRLNTIRYNQIIGNEGAYGGGISLWYASASFFENKISHNTATSDEIWGGGVHLFRPETLNFEGNTVSDNKVYTENVCAGAGVACIYAEDISTFRNNKFTGNAGPIYSTYPQLVNYGSGGGLLITGADENEIIIDGNIFKADTAKYGGGLSIKHSFNVRVVNNLFMENNAYYGGGVDIVNIDWKSKDVFNPQFVNNTFFNNTTEDNGYAGAMYLRCEYNLPPLVFNSIYYENQSPNGNDIFLYNNSDTVLIAYSNIDPANIAGNSPWKEFENINENPGFIDDDCHIDDSSPCKDMGVDSLEVAGIWYYAPETDYEGDPRPLGEGVDMGADESDIVTIVPHLLTANVHGIVLRQNRPNPFSCETSIELVLPCDERVTLKVFDLSGREIETPVAGYFPKGDHTFILNSQNLNSGIYLYVLSAGEISITKKMVVRK